MVEIMINDTETKVQSARLLTSISYLAMFSVGLVVGSLGPLLVPISDFFQLRIAQVGYPVVFLALGFLAGTMVVSFAWHRCNSRMILTFFSLCFVLLSLLIALFPYGIGKVLAFLFGLGLSGGTIITGIGSLFSELHGQVRERTLNVLHVFVGAGAAVGPLVVGILLTYTSRWQLTYLLIASVSAPLPLLFLAKSLYTEACPLEEREAIRQSLKQKKPLQSILFWSSIIAMFLYVGIEASFTSWTPVFLTRARGFSPIWASYTISFFWLGLILGRAVLSRFLRKETLLSFLTLAAAGAALFSSLTFLNVKGIALVFLVTCSGLSLGCVFPGLLALSANIFPRQVGFISGVVTGGGTTGSMVFPWIIGSFAAAVGLKTAVFLIPVLGGVLVSVLLYVRYPLNRLSVRRR